jgi:autotransporter-associated beta strand protein
MNMQNPPNPHRTRLFLNRIIPCTLLALIAPLVAMAQQTVFYDTFGTSTLNQTNIAGGIPGGTASTVTPYSASSYTIGSAKDARATTVGSGLLRLQTVATSSGNSEAQALFTKYPVSLAAVGDYMELTYAFTARYPILQASSAAATALFVGLFNSGGVAPQAGATAAILQNSGYTSANTAASGGVKEWVGYHAQMYNLTSGWRIYARPKQTADQNLNQVLLYNYPLGLANGGFINPPSPDLIPGTQYTVQMRITLSAAGQLTVSNALYTGVDTSGAQFTNTSWVVTGANVLSTNFDGLAIGYRSGNPAAWTNDINYIKVVASLAAQAGPYFFVNSSGDPCSGGVSVGLSGSVTTNTYLLYTNGVDSGQSVAGTGSAISFGPQTTPGTYTIYASNLVTASVGPMYGSASVFAPGVSIGTQPSSVSVVTNLPTSFTVAAVGASLSYQWFKNGVPLTNNANLTGATTPTLSIAAAGAADAATALNGYTVVASTPCGNYATSAPPAALTLTAPRNLIWAGGVVNSSWNYTDQEFTLAGSPTAFAPGDNATFNDSSSFQSVTVSNNLTATLVSVVGTKSYTFSGPNGLTGISQLVDGSSGTLTIINDNVHTGGTVVSNGATLSIGDGTSVKGSVTGTVTVAPGGTLNYNSQASSIGTVLNIKNALAGSGTVNFNDAAGATYATGLGLISSNFSGTINIQGFTRLHASDNNAGYAFGNGSTVNVPANTQAWLDRSATAYNNTFNIAGNGWIGVALPTGAMSMFGNTVNGPINLLADARIGGSINGGTIQSVISGPYRLEVWGTTNSYVLTLGPTNGSPQAYASTLITAGSISAVNSNAISRGPLTLDSGGDLRVNGNNLTVSNLSSLNSGSVLLIEGPRVRNMHATLPGTLTVGLDDSSSQFDGTFSDGAAAAFGLTKVGNGTLTLTAISTNTGAVTVNGGTLAMSGSGSFGKATQIIANNGGFYDVTGAGGTLTLNSGQTLRGNGGTVNGIVVAAAGSTVAPGFPMGTLTVSGNGTVNGIYRANLNRTNSPSNCSKFTSSGGSITYSGATLSVTNVGPKLQAGDFFQLFPGSTAGFSSSALQTNDVPNNAKYTWTDTVSSNGRITVATVAFIVNPNPTNIVASVSGGVLTLSWPSDYTGWTLQTQTNALSKGLGTNWTDVAGSAATNKVIVPVASTNGSVFFRMKY